MVDGTGTRRMAIAMAGVLLLAACTGDNSTPDAASSSTSTTVLTTTTSERLPEPDPERLVTVVGEAEVVWDWTTDRCEDEHIPDIAARAFRDAGDRVQLSIGHYVTYRMVGPSLDELVTDCSGPVLESDYDPDPSQFNDSEWLGSPYTLDGETVYAVIHNEYRGDTHRGVRPAQCPSGERLACLDTSFTMAVSTNRGDTFDDIVPAPGHVIATLPYTYADNTIPTGIRQPSNIVQGPDDAWYLFGNVSAPPDERQWVCAMRTDDLADPTAWRYWDGTDFAGAFVDPYLVPAVDESDTCAPLAFDALGGSIQESVIWDELLERWIIVGIAPSLIGDPNWGVYYSTSTDLLDWSARRLLLPLPVSASVEDNGDDLFYAYPTLIDPDSSSRNFETTDGSAYLYISRFNAGGNSLDRDLLRYPIQSEVRAYEPPEWLFDTDGDAEGWVVDNTLAPATVADGIFITESIADDPWLLSGPLAVPALFDRFEVRMRVAGNGEIVTGQLFFTTDTSPATSERASMVFDTIADGEWHDYFVDLSTVAAWDGTITGLRLDPVPDGGRTIEIDRMAIGREDD